MQTAILVASGLLLFGFVLRAKLRLLQTCYIPASIAGGLAGLGIVQAAMFINRRGNGGGAEPLAWLTTDVVGELRTWPGWLIAVVFAGLLMESPSQGWRSSLRRAGQEGLMVWIIVLGQTAIGLVITWLVLAPLFGVPPTFGVLIETGFAGGHGTAAAMGEILEHKVSTANRLPADLGQFMATAGLVLSVVTGIGYVNLAVRRGWTHSPEVVLQRIGGLERSRDPVPLGWARVNSEVLDPLVFQALLLATAFLLGTQLSAPVSVVVGSLGEWLVDRGVPRAAFSLALLARIGDFPLFIYTLMGGLCVRKVMQAMKLLTLLDTESLRRLTSAAMEFLVVAAIASLNLQAVSATLAPLLILVAAAVIWTGLCLLLIGRWLLPSAYWLELGLINYGMSTGTTATGLVLLRIVDEKLQTRAAEDYAIAAPLSSPFVGGGLVTLAMPLLLDRVSIGAMAASLTAVVVSLLLLGLMWARSRPATGQPD